MYGNKLNQWDSTCSGILGDSLTICDQGYIYLNFSFNIFEIIKLLESVKGSVAAAPGARASQESSCLSQPSFFFELS